MKHKFVKLTEGILLSFSAIFIAGSFYFIGNITSLDSQPNEIQIIYPENIANKGYNNLTESSLLNDNSSQNSIVENKLESQVIASKNGKRYYYKNCGGVNRIKPENRIYFENKEQAELKGLTLASGCKEL